MNAISAVLSIVNDILICYRTVVSRHRTAAILNSYFPSPRLLTDEIRGIIDMSRRTRQFLADRAEHTITLEEGACRHG